MDTHTQQKQMRKTLLSCAILTLLPLAAAAQTSRTMTIDELFSLLDKGNRTLRARQAGVDEATHGIAEAKSRRLPDVDASLSVSYNGNVVMTDRDFGHARGLSQPHLGNSLALEARQTVYAGGAIDAGIRLAELQQEASETSLALTRTEQRLLALGQYLDLFKLDNQLAVYDSNIALTRQLITDIKEKREQGMALTNDVTRYELQMETLRLGQRRLQDQRAVLNYQLCHTLGMEQTVITPDTTFVAASYPVDDERLWQERATASSPALQLSDLDCRMAEQQVRLAKSDLLPKVAVFAANNFSGPFTYDIPPIDKNFNIWYVGIGVQYSISALFKSNKSVRRANAALAATRYEQAVTEERVDNGVQQAHTLYLQAYAELATQRKSVELARQNYKVMTERYLNQLALVTDMVDASNMKLSAELQETNARTNIVFAYYKLKYVSGEI